MLAELELLWSKRLFASRKILPVSGWSARIFWMRPFMPEQCFSEFLSRGSRYAPLKSSMECLPFYESEVDGDEKQWHRSQKATMHTIKTANEKNPIEDTRILVNTSHQHI